ncbi:hypothetical protein [Bacillus marasmi]|uniref:hypothetical protein n=1 Tax=Bacillus marasmi TaxID=1926279 RepID=UPI00164D0B7F|nr:hypothetical protein [Bacillus marasmi]
MKFFIRTEVIAKWREVSVSEVHTDRSQCEMVTSVRKRGSYGQKSLRNGEKCP